jgi:glycerophosphoryl diester phosphodiesterase
MTAYARGLFIVSALLLAACGGIDLQGHRGARGLAPENTLPAFARALSLGVTTLELDVGITRDGVVVVSHDPTLSPDLTRAPGGAWLAHRGPPIHHLTYSELARYDVGRLKPGSAYAARYPAQEAVDGTRIPRLADVFALTRKALNHDVRFNIETKLSPLANDETAPPGEFVARLVDEIRLAGMERRSSIQSFDWRTLQIVQQIAPEIPTVYLTAEQPWLDNIRRSATEGSPWTAGFRFRDLGSVPSMVRRAGGAVWSPYFGDLTGASLQEAHALGLKVVVWTVNRPEDIRRQLDLGVDGIISDRPDLVRAELAARKLPLPTATPVHWRD